MKKAESGKQPVNPALIPPHAQDAEMCVLGAILIQGQSYLDLVTDLITPESFYLGSHRVIYEAFLYCKQAGLTVDVVQVGERLRAVDQLKLVRDVYKAGGAGLGALTYMMNAVPALSETQIRDYAQIIADKYLQREIIRSAQTIVAEGYQAVDDVRTFADTSARKLHDLAYKTSTSDTLEHVGDVGKRVVDQLEEAERNGSRFTGISTGFIALDRCTGGLHDGDLTIIGARPGAGKSALALNVGVNVASLCGHWVVYFSLEMPNDQLLTRASCSAGNVELTRVRTGCMSGSDKQNFKRAALTDIGKLPIYIDDKPAQTMVEMSSKVARVKRLAERQGKRVGLVIIDYIQLAKGSSIARKQGRTQEVDELAQDSKDLAKTHHVPVIALAQLSRLAEGKTVPTLSMLRESGNLEQAADNVFFISQQPSNPDLAYLSIAKQRNGPTDLAVEVRFVRQFTRFEGLE